jgi:hypothetical protein
MELMLVLVGGISGVGGTGLGWTTLVIPSDFSMSAMIAPCVTNTTHDHQLIDSSVSQDMPM